MTGLRLSTEIQLILIDLLMFAFLESYKSLFADRFYSIKDIYMYLSKLELEYGYPLLSYSLHGPSSLQKCFLNSEYPEATSFLPLAF